MAAQNTSQYSYKPQINQPKTAAQFEKMQKKFQERLNKSKSEMRVTVPKSPFSRQHTS